MPDKAKPDDPAQSQRFIDIAREVGGNEDQTVFDKVFENIAKPATPSTKIPEKK